MKVAVFHLGFFYSGGGEKLVLEEIRGLRKRGHEVVCFTPVLDREHCFPGFIDQFDLRLILPQLPWWMYDGQMLQVLLCCVLFPFTLWRYRKFDVVLGANQPSAYFGWLIKKVWGIPYVIYLAQPTRHLYPRPVDLETNFGLSRGAGLAYWLARLARPLVAWLDRTSIQKADAMLTNGDYIGRRLEQVYCRDRINCPAGCWPLEPYPAISPRLSDRPYLLLTNRHFPQKKFEYAIEVLPLVLEKRSNLSLIITGAETAYTQSLKRLIDRLGLGSKVVFTGLVREEELTRLYSRAAVYLYTSPQEDFGMGVVEAMAHGTPVVAWNNGGPTVTLLDGVTGYLARPFEIGDFADKITLLLQDQSNYSQMSRAAYHHAKANFSYDKHNSTVEKVLKEACRYVEEGYMG